ncbi:MAG: recombination-associated protein RdgC [Porticoccaceae bacterium]
MKIINNAHVYRAALPSPENLALHLQELPYQELSPLEMNRASFVPNEVTRELVTPIQEGYAFTFQFDEKIIPTSAVNAKVAKAVAKIKEKEDRTVGRKERQEIKDNVIADMCRVAFVKTTKVNILYREACRTLIVITGSKNISDCATGALAKVAGSIKSETIHIEGLKMGLTTRLGNYFGGSGSDPFAPFHVGNFVKLKGDEGLNFSTETKGAIHEAEEGILEAIGEGAQVERIELEYNGCNFKLTNDFAFKAISFDVDVDADDRGDMDAPAYWRHEAGVYMLIFVGVIDALCKLMDYVPPEK